MKRSFRTSACAALLATLGAASALASPLVAKDLLTTGDALVTEDQSTDLQWLDVPATQDLSVDQVLAGAGGWRGLGFRYATFDEFKGLLTSAGMTGADGYSNPTSLPGMHGSAAVGHELLGLVGATFEGEVAGLLAPTPCGAWTSGVCDQHLEHGVWTDTDSYTYIVRLESNEAHGINTIDASGASATFVDYPWAGSWLVRVVPEPANSRLMLLGLCLALLAHRARRSLPGRETCQRP